MFARILNNERGIALVVALSIMVLMTLLATAALYRSTLEVKISGNEKVGLQAYYAALAGLRDAERRLMLNTSDTRGDTFYNSSAIDWSVTVSEDMPTDTRIGYSVTITHLRDSLGTAVDMADPPNDDFPQYRLTSTGYFFPGTGYNYPADKADVISLRQVEKVIGLEFSNVWSTAVTACGDLYINSNSGTDSYDSTAGPYDSGTAGSEGDIVTSGTVSMAVNAEFKGGISAGGDMTLGNNSDIWGNVATNGNITLTGSAAINGDAEAVGTINNPGNVTGTSTAGSSNTVETPAACDPDNKLPIPSDVSTGNSNGSGSGNDGITCAQAQASKCPAACFDGSGMCNFKTDITLTGSGDPDNPTIYYFKGLTLESGNDLTTTGYVEIYVDGNTLFEGNNSIWDGDTQTDTDQLLLYTYGESNDNPGTASTVDLNSNVEFYGKIYSPDASMTLINSNSKVYGSVIGGGMCSSCGEGGGVDANAGVHFDTNLSTKTPPTASATDLQQFRECYNGAYSAAYKEYYIGSCKPGE